MRSDGQFPDAVAYNALLLACARAADGYRRVLFFCSLVFRRFLASAFAPDKKKAKREAEERERAPATSPDGYRRVLLFFPSSFGGGDRALDVLEEMREFAIPVDVVAYNTALKVERERLVLQD